MKEIIVCDLYLIEKKGRIFDPEVGKTLHRTGMKVSIDYMETINHNTWQNGKMFVINDKLNNEYKKLRSQKNIRYKNNQTSTDLPDMDKQQLMAYLDEKGIDYKKSFGESKLLEIATKNK